MLMTIQKYMQLGLQVFLLLLTCTTCTFACTIIDNKALCSRYPSTTFDTKLPKNITVVNLESNKLERIPYNAFGNSSELREIRLDRNNINTLDEGAFYGLPKLYELQLTGNNLSMLPDSLFEPSASLQGGVLLINNKISQVPLGALRNVNNQGVLYLTQNPIHCDCFAVIPAQKKLNIRANCETPAKLKGQSVSNLKYDDVSCQICTSFDCGYNGACYTSDGVTAKCKCFDGYYGEYCNQTMQLGGYQTDYKNIIPSLERVVTFTGNLEILKSNTTFASTQVTFKGCRFSSEANIPSPAIRWLKDGLQWETKDIFIQSPKLITLGLAKYLYEYPEVQFNTADLSDVGSYQCVFTQTGSSEMVKSPIKYLYFDDVSDTLITGKQIDLKWSDELLNRSSTLFKTEDMHFQARVHLTSYSGSHLNSIGIKITTITFRNTGSYVEVVGKIVFYLPVEEKKLKLCQDLRRIAITNVDSSTPYFFKFTNRDCCFSSDQGEKYLQSVTLIGQALQCQSSLTTGISYASCVFDENYGTSWSPKNFKACYEFYKNSDSKLNMLVEVTYCQVIYSGNVSRNNCSYVSEVSNELSNITKEVLNHPSQIEAIVKVVEHITKHMEANTVNKEKILSDVLETASNILENRLELIAASEKLSQTSTKITRVLESMPLLLSNELSDDKEEINIQKKNVAMAMRRSAEKNAYVMARSAHLHMPLVVITYNQSDINDSIDAKTTRIIEVPKENLKVNSSLIVAFVFRENKYFLTEKEILGRQDSTAIDGMVISTSIGNETILKLIKPIVLSFKKSFKNKDRNGSCKFWDYNQQTSIPGVFGGWSERGCKRIQSNETDVIQCECNHLTNFALILNIEQQFQISFPLSIISWIGCGISIASLVVTIIVHIYMKTSREKLAPMILISLCFSLLAVLVIFLAAVERTSSKRLCKGIAFILQYFMLTTFCWMFVEGINLYLNFVSVYLSIASSRISLFKRFSWFGWGVPAIIVSITFGLRHEEFGNVNICLANGNSFFYGLLAPVIVILTFNWIIIVLAIRGMRGSKAIGKHVSRRNHFKTEVWRIFVCSVILGLTWTFGLFAIKSARDVFQWLFCIANSLQGFLIFLLFVIANKEVRDSLKRRLQADSHSSELDLAVPRVQNVQKN